MMPAPDRCPRRAPRILVIDDEPDIRDLMDMLLSSAGYEVSTAEDGAVAVERTERDAFDLAVTDLRMPGMSGIDTLVALKRIDPDLPVIVVSGYLSDESAQRACAEGAAHVLCKPIDVDALLHIVGVALRDHRGQARLNGDPNR
jgi:two-component system response regulator PilR (NtrC family)